MPSSTPNYSFQLPIPGGDNDVWGGYLNANWTTADTEMKANADAAAAADAKAVAAQNTANTADGKADANAAAITTLDGRVTQNETDISSNFTALGEKIDKSGGTMTGALVLAGAPSADLEAATKKYIDDAISGLSNFAPIASASTNAAGTILAGTGLTVSVSGNSYIYTFVTPRPDLNYHVSYTDYYSITQGWYGVTDKTVNGFTCGRRTYPDGGFIAVDHTVVVLPII